MGDIEERLESLAEFEIDDDQRNIEANTQAITVNTITETNFIDRNAYDSKFLSDMYIIGKIKDVLERGKYFVNIIYTYRSVSKAIPQAKNTDDAKFKEELNTKTLEVLVPEIQKVKDLYQFHKDTVNFFCVQIKHQVSDERKTEVISEELLWHLIKLLDLLALLDALLNMKACLVTDFSVYKRLCGSLKSGAPSEDSKVLADQGLFLAKQNRITEHLKNEIKEIKLFDEILVLVVNMCATYIENERYVLPEDKHSLLRVIPYALFLMDGREGNLVNIFKNKKINVKRFSTIFKKYPIVTLYGDMQIKLENMIKSAPNYVAGSWPLSDTDRMAREYEIIHHLPTIRQQHSEYMGKFNTIVNMVKLDDQDTNDHEFCSQLTNIVLDGLILLSNWTSRVLQQSAWKYFKPNTSSPIDNNNNNSPNNNSDNNLSENQDNNSVQNSYENVVRRNYSKEECFALAEMVGLIKGLSNCMIDVDGLLSPFIRSCIHSEIQHVVQLTIGEILNYATKKKRPIRVDLTQIRTLSVDFVDGSGIDESVFSKKKKDVEFTIPSRPVGPSITQLNLLRLSIYNLYATRMNGKRPFEKDISKENSKILEDFYARSFNYYYLLNYKDSIIEMIDLGDLWYREFYLELTKRLQFPIKLSLPWILTETILDSEDDLSMMEYVLYPLDIYNDAANRALSKLNQQFLFDEIEAEVNLCFDQLTFKLSNSIYTSIKIHASSLLFDNPYRLSLEQILQSKLRFPKTKYDVIISQRHYQLLGKFVDLNSLISQRINNLLRKNIDNAISRFEAKDLSSIVELETQLNVIKLTHHLLSLEFKNQIDSYDSIFNEINGSSSLVSYHSRIAFHIISECASDFFPNYNYNSSTNRFIRCIIEFGDQIQRENQPSAQLHWLYGDKKLTVAYSAYHANFSKIFGIQHVKSLFNVLGSNNIALIIDEILTNLHLKIDNVLLPYVSELMNAMPPNSKCPLYDYRVSGGIGYFSGKLIDIIQYPPLQSDVFQQFKEMGNAITFIKMIDSVLEDICLERHVLISPLLGINSLKTLKEQPSPENAPLYKRAKDLTDYLKSLDKNNDDDKDSEDESEDENNQSKYLLSSKKSLEPILSTLWEQDYNLRKRSNSSLFTSALDQIYNSVSSVRNEWDQQTPEEGAVIPIESATEFYRLFSALKYIYCLPLERGQGEYDAFDLFGDGLLWSGITIIHLLGQRKRFECFDFANHLLRVSQVYPPEQNEKMAIKFIENAERVRNLSDEIFTILGNNIPEYQPFIVQIHPPVDDSDASQFKISSTHLNQSENLRASSVNVASAVSPRPPPTTTSAVNVQEPINMEGEEEIKNESVTNDFPPPPVSSNEQPPPPKAKKSSLPPPPGGKPPPKGPSTSKIDVNNLPPPPSGIAPPPPS